MRAFDLSLAFAGPTRCQGWSYPGGYGLPPGDLVERRYGHGEHRFGQIQGRVREGYDAWYVNCDVGMTFCDNGRDLRRTSERPADD